MLATSLLKRLILSLIGLFGFSLFGIRLIRSLLLPLYLVRGGRSWKPVLKYLKRLRPEQSALRSLLQSNAMRVDEMVWSILVHDAWDFALKYNDFSCAHDLQTIAARRRGLLMLGMHYGPMFGGFVLHKLGLNPVILSAEVNIPDLDGVPFKRVLSNQTVFRGTYDGMLPSRHSEKRFVKMLIAGRPGMMLIDGIGHDNPLLADCLGVQYPIRAFAFKLALRHSLPVVVFWWSKIHGRGYRLNYRQIEFSTAAEGVARYAALLDQIVRADPLPWHYGTPYTAHFNRTVQNACRQPASPRAASAAE